MSAPFRVVHVCRQFKPGVGGLESALDALTREQVKAGMNVRVVTLDRVFGEDRKEPRRERIDGVDIARIPFVGSRRYPIAPGVLAHIRDADIVHVHGVDFFFDFLAWTKPLHRKPLVASTHGGFFHTAFASRLKRVYFATATRVSTRAYGFLAASSGSDAATFGRLRRRGVGAIENGVDIDKFAGAAREPAVKRLIYFGRFAPHKGLEKLLPFLAALRALDGDWRLTLAGRRAGVEPIEILRAAERLGLDDAIEIIETPSDDTLRVLIGASGAFVSASNYEGFGIAAIEALSAGLLPALSDIPAHRETVARTGCGALVAFDDPGSAADAFLEARTAWLADESRQSRAAAAVRQYDWGAVAARFDDMYQTVLGRRRRAILGLPVAVTRFEDALREADERIEQARPLRLAFVNANLACVAARDEKLAHALQDFTLLNDGVGVDLASALLYRRAFGENLNGTDFTPAFLDRSRHDLRVFLLGAKPQVLERARARFAERWPRHVIVGARDGYWRAEEADAVAAQVKEAHPHLVLVAMGNPLQEQWVAEHIPQVCPVAFCVGAWFDFLAEAAPRAPDWIRRARMEWAFRLSVEPARLWRRYLLGNAAFVTRSMGQYFSGARA